MIVLRAATFPGWLDPGLAAGIAIRAGVKEKM